ncbi:hypothetical protein HY484_03000 [Candidatus Woesearchaeota archaeon]|nr:hypothetical protein [Candidatus Woesearchaeota archaeon]
MAIDQQTSEKITKALASNKLDVQLIRDFSDLLTTGNQNDLEKQVLYSARGKPTTDIPDVHYIAGEIHTAHTTYAKLLELVENKDFYYFQKSRKLRPV